MKSKKTVILILVVLLLLTAGFAVWHLNTRENVSEGSLLVRQNGKDRYVDPQAFFRTQVTGVIVNGKGEERSIDALGVALGELSDGVYAAVTVTADDEYSAQVAAEEAEGAFLILNDDGSVQLVVFGDANSKRAVRNVIKIEFE